MKLDLLMKRGPFILWLALLCSTPTFAEGDFDPERDVPVSAVITPTPIDQSGTLKIGIALPANTHITSVENGFFFITPDSVKGIEWSPAIFPAGQAFEGETVYKGQVGIEVPFSLSSSFNAGDRIEVNGILGYQICTEVEPIYCTPPVEREFKAVIEVSGQSAGIANVQPIQRSVSLADAPDEALSIEERAKRALESGSAAALLWVFIGGVLLSFTPCVYPVIPITIAFIGGRSGGSRLKGFSLSLVFVLGLAIVYSTLGVVAAATGGVFGLSTQNPWVIGLVTIVFLIMGVGMMGAFEIQLPSSMQTAMASKKRSGYLGALFVGGTTGLVAAPCVGPVLVALLSWVATTGKILPGFLYLFVFACGLGLLFVVIGTFAGALSALPKAGGWMEHVKHFFGVIMIAAAFYFAKPMIPSGWFQLTAGAAIIMLAGLMGAFSKLESEAEFKERILRAVAAFVLIIGVFYTLLGLAELKGISLTGAGASNAGTNTTVTTSNISHSAVNWQHISPEEGLAQAKATGKPLLIDFWAEWCAACKELDHKTFSDPSVSPIINDRFIPVKVDGTKITPELKALWAKYGVKGLPTVVFMTHDGVEVERFEAFRTVEQTMPVLNRVLGN